MKTLKVKSILFSLLAMMAIAAFMTSCERQSVVEDDVEGWRLSSLLAEYPEEITIDNWEEFVHAPEEVINFFDKKEKDRLKYSAKSDEKMNCDNSGTKGWIKSYYNGSWRNTNNFVTEITNLSNGTVYTSNTTNTNTPYNWCIDEFYQVNPNPIVGFCNYWKSSDPNYVHNDWLNRVTTFDLVLIQRHIVYQDFDELREFISADVNTDGIINHRDIIDLRKLILGITRELPDNNIGIPNSPFHFWGESYYNYVQNDIDNGLITAPWLYHHCSHVWNSNPEPPFIYNIYALKRGDINGV